jgi:release factor glutamine methyltransferase
VTTTDVLRRATAYLERHGVDSPRATAEILLMHVLGTDRTGLYRRTEGLDTAQARRFGRALCQRCTGTPLQHLTGEQAFRRLRIRVRPGVFIPRPETEILVEHALAAIADVERPVVVDVGTGTGAIALAIADERRDAHVTAIDLSPDAVALARENAAAAGLDVAVHEGDLLDGVPDDVRGRVDLVVSNPPYVAADALEDLPDEVRADPELALLGGIPVYARIARAAATVVRPGGSVALEIGETQARDVADVLRDAGWPTVAIEQDLNGRDRVIVASRAR